MPANIHNDDWRDDLDRAFKLTELATTYADDGAYLTAADRLRIAADLFAQAHEKRLAQFSKAKA